MAIEKILIVDDEKLIRDFLAETLRRKNLEVTTADNGQKALALLKENSYDLVITDMKMPGLTGLDVLKKVKELSPATMVIVITAFGSVENAVEAMRCGALTYILKPFTPDTIEAIIDKAGEHQALVEENRFLRQEVVKGPTSSGVKIITESPAMKLILQQAEQAARSNANVFINGESGTGKEVIAHTIHHHSLRAQGPFIKVNCAAIPETLVESEFFGHEKGAFTGATARKLGRFELAHHGTLLLDEITEIPIGIQAKLLRAIQEQEFERIGGTKPIKVDVRLVSTSNREIKEAISQKFLREDLYYRLNVVPLYLPPLRERREDILPLADYFLEKTCKENHVPLKKLNTDAQKRLLDYPWPGNIRELANIIERAVVLDTEPIISAEHLFLTSSSSPSGLTLEELEKKHIIETLRDQKEDAAKAAKALGITLRKLQSKLDQYSKEKS